jgi:site-specific DNA recombinase
MRWQGPSGEQSGARNTKVTKGNLPMKPAKKSNQKTAAIYARYSSDIQNDLSIEDQFAICRTYAERNGLNVIKEFEFCDRAKSSATLRGRTGALELLEAVKERKFDVIIVECYDRLSRNFAELPSIYQRLAHAEIELHGLSDGIADPMKIGFRGIMGEQFLRDLKDKIRRHHVARAKAGLIMGIAPFGYRLVAGKPGEQEIDSDQAKIVVRIFNEYANGVSPRTIALGLTHDKIPAPGGSDKWSHQSFLGGGGKNGLLRNALYVGRYVYNKTKTTMDPDGFIGGRANPEEDIISTAVPHLRIIDQNLWEAVQAVRSARSTKSFGPGGVKTKKIIKRSSHLLSGLLRCGVCHEKMMFGSKSRGVQYVTCGAWKKHSSCTHSKSYNVNLLQDVIAKNWRAKLSDPERHKKAMKAAVAEYAVASKRDNIDKEATQAKIDLLSNKVRRWADAIAIGNIPIPELMTLIEDASREREGLKERLRLLNASNPNSNVRALPHVADTYLQTVEAVGMALDAGNLTPDHVMAFQNLIDTIVVQPTPERAGYIIDVFGRPSAHLGIEMYPAAKLSMEKILLDEAVSVEHRAAITATGRGQVQRGNTCR